MAHISNRWEYLTTFGFEWNIYTGKRPWRWSYIPYIATRTLCLSSIIIVIVGVNLKREFDCDVCLLILCHQCHMHTHSYPTQAWLRGIVVWLVDCPFFYMHADRSLPDHSLARGKWCLISSSASSVSDLLSLFPVTVIRSSSSIRIAIWSLDRRVVAFCVLAWLCGLSASLFGRSFTGYRPHSRVSSLYIPSHIKGTLYPNVCV